MEEVPFIERMRQQSKEGVERLMASFHKISSSSSNPILISDSPPPSSIPSNSPIPISPPISTRTRSHDSSFGLIRTRSSHLLIPFTLSQKEREQRAEQLRSTCEHKSLTWWETHIDGIVKMCDRCYQTFKEPNKNPQ